jgi:predicted dienelactone hydrolase
LISYWTSNGYVCIRPSHADAGALAKAAPDPKKSIWDQEREPQWRNRVEDIKLVLDSLDELERRFPELRGKMDRGRVGAGGHSYGALTVLQLRDARVKALLAMSPPGVAANRATTPQFFGELRVPTMFMTGTEDRGPVEGENAEWRKQAFDYSPAGDKYFVLIDGARHNSFAGALTPILPPEEPRLVARDRPPIPQRASVGLASERHILQIIKVASLAFWDAYLKNDSAARDLLLPQKFEDAFGGAHLTVK